MTSHNVWNLSLFEHNTSIADPDPLGSTLLWEAGSDLDTLRIGVKSWIRIRIKVELKEL
jgi:hypothetical protein